jgi:hypothetical protein
MLGSGLLASHSPQLSCPAKAGHPVTADAAIIDAVQANHPAGYWIIRLRG